MAQHAQLRIQTGLPVFSAIRSCGHVICAAQVAAVNAFDGAPPNAIGC